MRVMRWILLGLGLAGAVACGVGVVVTKRAKDDIAESTSTLATRARGLLDAVDAKLDGLPERLNRLAKSREPGPVIDELRQVESRLQSARESSATVRSMLQAAIALKQGETRALEDRFPKLAGIGAGLADLAEKVRAQIANVETWTLRFAVLTAGVEKVRANVDQTRQETERLEADALGVLDTIALIVIGFLVWMGLGQVALAFVGRRRAAQ